MIVQHMLKERLRGRPMSRRRPFALRGDTAGKTYSVCQVLAEFARLVFVLNNNVKLCSEGLVNILFSAGFMTFGPKKLQFIQDI